jgi:polysaccharide export outer membrane protein
LKEGEARGMSESQIEAAAMANGYSVMDIAKVRERIARLKASISDTTSVQSTASRKQLGEVAKRTIIPVSDSLEVGKKKEVYGFSIFNNKKQSFEPNLQLPTPPNYILGAGDELKVDITGYAYQHYDLKVSPEGTVKLESLSPISVSGLIVTEAKQKILSRLKTLFAGLRNGSLNLDMTLGDIKTIQVNVLGEAVNPGSYSISSFATAFNCSISQWWPYAFGIITQYSDLPQ